MPPIVLYGCEAWSLVLKSIDRLMLFGNKVSSRIFVCKR